jgi:hypothetical protein
MFHTNDISLNDEQWKLINGETEYMVSDMGNVMSLKHGKMKLLKPQDLNNGYKYVRLSAGKNSKIHKLVLNTFMNNDDKKYCVDHINGNRSDNRLINLRYATSSENRFNSRTSTKNTSQYTGVCFDIAHNKWKAYITVNGKNHHKLFKEKEDAVKHRQFLLDKYVGEFQCSDSE